MKAILRINECRHKLGDVFCNKLGATCVIVGAWDNKYRIIFCGHKINDGIIMYNYKYSFVGNFNSMVTNWLGSEWEKVE